MVAMHRLLFASISVLLLCTALSSRVLTHRRMVQINKHATCRVETGACSHCYISDFYSAGWLQMKKRVHHVVNLRLV